MIIRIPEALCDIGDLDIRLGEQLCSTLHTQLQDILIDGKAIFVFKQLVQIFLREKVLFCKHGDADIGTVIALDVVFDNSNNFIRGDVVGLGRSVRNTEHCIRINGLDCLFDSAVEAFFVYGLQKIIAGTTSEGMLGIGKVVIAADRDYV